MNLLIYVKRVKIIILAVIVILVTCLFFYWLLILWPIKMATTPDLAQIAKRQQILLYETDWAELLAGCRKVMREASEGKWEYKQYVVGTRRPDPDSGRFPPVLLRLNPTYIWIEENTIVVEMLGGMGHFGVQAYKENFQSPLADIPLGDKELIPGLWYYDDGYLEDPNYDQYIESLRPKK